MCDLSYTFVLYVCVSKCETENDKVRYKSNRYGLHPFTFLGYRFTLKTTARVRRPFRAILSSLQKTDYILKHFTI